MSERDMTPDDMLALDMLHHASVYISKQWKFDLDRAHAKANLEARAIFFNASNQIFMKHGCGISREEVYGAQIIERELLG